MASSERATTTVEELLAGALPEVEELIACAKGMKRLLEEGPDCECLTLDQCGVLLRD